LAGPLVGAGVGLVILLAHITVSDAHRGSVMAAVASRPSVPKAAELPATPVAAAPPAASDEPVVRTVLEHGKATRLAPNTFHAWDDYDGDPKTFKVGEVTLTWASGEMRTYNGYPDPFGLLLKVSAPGLKTRTITLGSVSRTYFGVGRIDPTRPGPQVLFTEDSGGRGCCTVFYLLTPGQGRWRLDRLGHWNQLDDDWPTDRDGDGIPEIRLLDEVFKPYPLAAFEQWPPPRFIQVRDGKAEDVSRRPGLARFYREHVRRTLPACRKGDNYACTGLVAAAARLGRKDWAWKIMLRSYDREAYGQPWVDCTAAEFAKACETPETLYPVALRATLTEYGYWPGSAVRDAYW
jgi:hypothetical protein